MLQLQRKSNLISHFYTGYKYTTSAQKRAKATQAFVAAQATEAAKAYVNSRIVVRLAVFACSPGSFLAQDICSTWTSAQNISMLLSHRLREITIDLSELQKEKAL